MDNILTTLWKRGKKQWGVSRNHPSTTDSSLETGVQLLSLGLWRVALPHLHDAVRFSSHRATAHYYRGVVHEHFGDYTRAVKDYTAAVLLDPHCVPNLRGKNALFRSHS